LTVGDARAVGDPYADPKIPHFPVALCPEMVGYLCCLEGRLRPNPEPRDWRREGRVSLRVFGRLPGTDAMRDSEAGVRKASMEETAGGACASGGVGLWGFSAQV
jgi:hypothetical protein